jgi:tetratricopeptide (TPR) repeat protein
VWTRLYFAGDLERQIGELEEEKESLEKDKTKLEQDKKELELKTKKVVQDIWLLDVERLLDTDKPDEAMRQIDQALAQQPQDGMFVFTKARILKRQATLPGVPEAQKHQLLDQAIDYANRAIALLPGKPEPIYNKACYEALLDVDKYKKQILADLESAFKMNPGLKKIAADDSDLKDLRDDAEFKRLISESGQPSG